MPCSTSLEAGGEKQKVNNNSWATRTYSYWGQQPKASCSITYKRGLTSGLAFGTPNISRGGMENRAITAVVSANTR